MFGRKRKNTKWREFERKVLKGTIGPEKERDRDKGNRNPEKIS